MVYQVDNRRFISNTLSAQSGPIPNTVKATDMMWGWGQFLDHDISFTPEGDPKELLPIAVPIGDPVFDPFRTGQRTIAFNRSALTRARVQARTTRESRSIRSRLFLTPPTCMVGRTEDICSTDQRRHREAQDVERRATPALQRERIGERWG